MKWIVAFLFSFLWGICILSAQNPNYIKVIVPENDSTSIAASNQRINGCTLPGSVIRINGEALKVYPSGAFAGFIPLKPGKNQFLIESVHPKAGVATKTLLIESRIREKEKAVADFAIESANLVPSVDQDLGTGDVIQVRMKAQPGCQAFFLKNKPMYELPVSQTGGVAGIFQGSYQIQSTDTIPLSNVEFRLAGPSGNTITALSRNKISANTGKFPAVAYSRGTFPYFCYGLGEDRLGGARISYLDTMVYMTLSGRAGNLYQVKLSESQFVYIPVDNVALMPKGTFAPWSLTDSWTVSGDDKYDYLRIGLSQRVPYISAIEINPARIVLFLYGAVSNTNWITQLKSAREIKNVYYSQTEKNVTQVFIELKNQQSWGYSVYYQRNQLVVRVKRQPVKLELSGLTIGLDAGHGGSASGAVGSTGVKEKDINLAVVLKLKAALEKQGAKISLTRQGDEDLSTIRRWQIWKESDPDLVLSFHCNSIGNSDPNRIKGTSTYYKYIAFRPLSQILYDEMLETGLTEFGNIGSFNFTLNAPTEFPNALIEMAFLSNPEDEMLLLNPQFQDKIVKGTIAGLKKFLKQSR